MLTLNLVDINYSDINYRIDSFPDGQNQVIIKDLKEYNREEDKNISIEIYSRLNNFIDLEKIICAVQSLKALRYRHISLYVPYIVGGRSDRKFEDGGNNYVKDVLAPVINSLGFDEVITYDAHSDVLEATINNLISLTNFTLVEAFLAETGLKPINLVMLSPDAGACKKIYKLVDKLKDNWGNFEVYTCSKDRGNFGEINRTVVPSIDSEENIVIIDDIIDGGRTFINIAKVLKERSHKGKIYLIVSHGIFSKGYKELSEYFDTIYTTNSYQEIGDYTGNDVIKTNVKVLLKMFNKKVTKDEK